MRKRSSRNQEVRFRIPRDTVAFITLAILLGYIVYAIPPDSLPIIFLAFLIFAILIYYVVKPLLRKRMAILIGLAVGSGSFLFALDMLDVVNGAIWLGLVFSVGLFMNQK